jgi:hypothetical protein
MPALSLVLHGVEIASHSHLDGTQMTAITDVADVFIVNDALLSTASSRASIRCTTDSVKRPTFDAGTPAPGTNKHGKAARHPVLILQIGVFPTLHSPFRQARRLIGRP